ncbi:hypothetical protein HQ590_10460 [bacterium]|nr:hypothetical protein [bacterium]
MQIEIDFDVFKALTARRVDEQTRHNDVIRDLLGLPAKVPNQASSNRQQGGVFTCDGIQFPNGTEFRMKHKQVWHPGRIEGGNLVVNGKDYSSVSRPACEVTSTSVNGWRCWECRFPGEEQWQQIDTVRKNRRRTP